MAGAERTGSAGMWVAAFPGFVLNPLSCFHQAPSPPTRSIALAASCGRCPTIRQLFCDDLVRRYGSAVSLGAIAETIDHDDDLRGKRGLLLSIDGVGQILAALVLAKLPGHEVITRGAQAVAYAGLNPRLFQSGTSVNRPTRISKLGNATLAPGCSCRR